MPAARRKACHLSASFALRRRPMNSCSVSSTTLAGAKIVQSELPVYELIQNASDVIRPAVLEVQIIGVLPDIDVRMRPEIRALAV